eukprot:6508966-Alexandrium_andersonii.AAC.1
MPVSQPADGIQRSVGVEHHAVGEAGLDRHLNHGALRVHLVRLVKGATQGAVGDELVGRPSVGTCDGPGVAADPLDDSEAEDA